MLENGLVGSVRVGNGQILGVDALVDRWVGAASLRVRRDVIAVHVDTIEAMAVFVGVRGGEFPERVFPYKLFKSRGLNDGNVKLNLTQIQNVLRIFRNIYGAVHRRA